MVAGMLGFIIRFLTFRSARNELLGLRGRHLLWGLFGTWIVGWGRYWDHPDAELLQYLGAGSVIYVFCLAMVFWMVIKGLRVPVCRYFNLLTMISLTSFPAILYAIPVERFLSMEAAMSANVWFLLIVAVWRVALFTTYIARAYQLGAWVTLLVMLLPLMAIVSSLFVLNLESAIFEIMAGLYETEATANDGAYAIVFLLTTLSYMGVIPVLIAYLITACGRWMRKGADGVDTPA